MSNTCRVLYAVQAKIKLHDRYDEQKTAKYRLRQTEIKLVFSIAIYVFISVGIWVYCHVFGQKFKLA